MTTNCIHCFYYNCTTCQKGILLPSQKHFSSMAGKDRFRVIIGGIGSSSCAKCLYYLLSSAIWLCFPPPWLVREQAFALWLSWHLQEKKRTSTVRSHSAWIPAVPSPGRCSLLVSSCRQRHFYLIPRKPWNIFKWQRWKSRFLHDLFALRLNAKKAQIPSSRSAKQPPWYEMRQVNQHLRKWDESINKSSPESAV